MCFPQLLDKKRPAALNLTPRQPGTPSTEASIKASRTPRFVEATAVHSPVDIKTSPFVDPNKLDKGNSQQPGQVGFGYISNAPDLSGNGPKSPLKSAMKVPGTPGRSLANPLSPTFKEEVVLEKEEEKNDQQQVKDIVRSIPVECASFCKYGKKSRKKEREAEIRTKKTVEAETEAIHLIFRLT